MNLYGDPQMLGTALNSFAKAAGVSAWADGLVSTLPEGTIEAAAATLSNAFPKIAGVIDSVMSEKKSANAQSTVEVAERTTRTTSPDEGTEEGPTT